MSNDVDEALIGRAVGCLVGLALGDALGAAVEFQAPGTFPPVTGMRGGGPFGLTAGQWTDDTSMALALADSIVVRGWDLEDQARRYVRWWRHGDYSVTGECFDIGITTAAALARFEGGIPALQSGIGDHRSAGNGSIMRLAPVAIAASHRYPDDLAGLVERCVDSSRPTHRAPQALSACAVFGVVLAALIAGEEHQVILDPRWSAWDEVRTIVNLHPEVDEVISGSHGEREPPEIVGSGYVVRSLEAALWAFGKHPDARGSLLVAVNLGDDADTTGAVCGQLSGAAWGVAGLPEDWLGMLAGRDEVAAIAAALVAGPI
ncbi:MAG: ADP-ribosylglycohydrolase family protein [Acidimicrobiia bacterium]